MSRIAAAFTLILASLALPALGGAPTVGEPLPELSISDRGELVMEGEEFNFEPWTSTSSPGKVHVIQYFGATMGDRDVFKPFTDRIEEVFEPGSVHVTTVLNMDAALWGTSGFVISELKENKKQYPEATMVVDEEGSGVETWDLGDEGTGVVVVDADGVVQFFSRGSLDEQALASTIELIRAKVDA